MRTGPRIARRRGWGRTASWQMVSFRQTCAGRKMVTAGGMVSGRRFRGRRVDRGERCCGRGRSPIGQRHAAGLHLLRRRLDGARMALDGSPRFTGEVELKQRRSRDARFLVCEDRGLRGWRLGPRSGVPRWRLTALRASGRNGIGFGRQGSDSALSPRRRTWASLVRRGRKNSGLRRAMVVADGSTRVRGRLDWIL